MANATSDPARTNASASSGAWFAPPDRPGLTRASTLALATTLVTVVLVFSQMFILCFPAPKLLAEAAPLVFAVAAAAAAGILRTSFPPFAIPLIAVLVFNLLSLARAGNEESFSLSFLPAAAAAAAAWLGSTLGAHNGERRLLLLAIILAHLACALYGIAQYYGLDPHPWSVDYGRGRVFSTIGNPNFLAGQMVLVLPLLAAIALTGSRWAALLAGFTFVACVLVMILAQTRGAWIGLACGMSVFGLLVRRVLNPQKSARRSLVPSLVILALATVFSVPSLNRTGISLPAQFVSSMDMSQHSARQRFFWWRGAAELLMSRPLTGVGMGNFVREFPRAARRSQASFSDLPPAFCDHPHNDYLYVLCEAGVLGLGILLWLAVSLTRLLLLAARGRRALAAGALAGAAGLAVHALWNMPSIIHSTLFTAGLMLGLFSPARQRAGRADSNRSVASPRQLAPAAVLLLAGAFLAYRPATLLVAQSYLNGARIMKEHMRYPPAAFFARQSLALTDAPWRQHFMLGSIFYSQGKGHYAESLKAFKEDEKQNPWGADAILHQGKALRQMGRLDEAEEMCRRALAIVPNYTNAAVALASIQYFRARTARENRNLAAFRRHLEGAQRWVRYALRFLPRHAEALKLKGFLAILAEDWDLALDAWRNYLKEKPDDALMRRRILSLEHDLPDLSRTGQTRRGDGPGRRK